VKVIDWNVIVRTESPAVALGTKGIRIAPTQWRSADVSVEPSLRAKHQPQEIARRRQCSSRRLKNSSVSLLKLSQTDSLAELRSRTHRELREFQRAHDLILSEEDRCSTGSF
jgi:hypothetical protein